MSKINKLNLNNVFYTLNFETPGFVRFEIDKIGELLVSVGNNIHFFDLTEIQKKKFLYEAAHKVQYTPLLIRKQNIKWATDTFPSIKRIYPFLKMTSFSSELTIKNFIKIAKNDNYKGLIINKTFDGIYVSVFGITYFIKNDYLIKIFVYNFNNSQKSKNIFSLTTKVHEIRYWLQKQFFIVTKKGFLKLYSKNIEKKVSAKHNIIRNIERLNFESKIKKLKKKEKLMQLERINVTTISKAGKFFKRNNSQKFSANFVFHATVIKKESATFII